MLCSLCPSTLSYLAKWSLTDVQVFDGEAPTVPLLGLPLVRITRKGLRTVQHKMSDSMFLWRRRHSDSYSDGVSTT